MEQNKSLSLYRFLLKLYPKKYRLEFEEDMIETLNSMLSVKTYDSKLSLTLIILKDYFISLFNQRKYATEESINEIPSSIKRDSSATLFLIAPFMFVYFYNIINLYFRHYIPIIHLESHLWVIYSIILPALGLIIVTRSFIVESYNSFISNNWNNVVSGLKKEWLIIYFGLAMLCLKVIF
jgi:hypothetical protein